jgi:hypothetical protein
MQLYDRSEELRSTPSLIVVLQMPEKVQLEA